MGIGGGRCGGGKHGLHVGQAPNPAAGVERPTKPAIPWPLQKHPFGPFFVAPFLGIAFLGLSKKQQLDGHLHKVSLYVPSPCL